MLQVHISRNSSNPGSSIQHVTRLKQLRPPMPGTDEAFQSVLNPKKEMDDIGVSSFLRLIERRSLINPLLPRTWAFDSFFYLAWRQGKFPRVQRWTKGQNILDKDFVLFPIHNSAESHWYLVVAEPKKYRIRALDSLGRARPVEVKNIFEYLKCFAKHSRLPFEEEFWLLEKDTPCVRQAKGTLHCGAYVCFYAERICQEQTVLEASFNPTEYRKNIATVLRRSVQLGRTDFTGNEWNETLFEIPDLEQHWPESHQNELVSKTSRQGRRYIEARGAVAPPG